MKPPATAPHGSSGQGAGAPAHAGRSRHYPELDALRGVAAFVVVLWHFDRLWEPSSLHPTVRFVLEQVLLPFLNGTSSVILFFLLSGFVLSLPYKRGTPSRYSVFLLRRLARIYLPYLAAMLLALFADWHFQSAIPHPDVSSWFSQTWTAPLTRSLILQHLLLVGNYDTAQINTAFWSLAVEMRLSILFPLLCIPLLRWRSHLAIALFSLLVLLNFGVVRFLAHRLDAVTAVNLSEMVYGTLSFSAGILLARWLEAIQSVWGSLTQGRRGLLFILSVALLEWSVDLKYLHLWAFTGVCTVAGGSGVLIIALCSRRASQLLNHRIPAWLGRVSYSLYLVHATVLFGLVDLFLGRVTRLQLLLPYLLLALISASVFFFLVEKPSIQLSRILGRRAALSPRPAPAPSA